MELCWFAYTADKEARSDLVRDYLRNEDDYTFNFTGALRRITNSNSKMGLADLIAVYVAVRGWEEFFQINRKGYNHIFPDGTLMWRLQPDDSRHSYVDNLKEGVDPEHVVQVFDDLMMQSVRDRSSDR